jgi:hypothetical protein
LKDQVLPKYSKEEDLKPSSLDSEAFLHSDSQIRAEAIDFAVTEILLTIVATMPFMMFKPAFLIQ